MRGTARLNKSKFPNQIAHTAFERLGKFRECFERDLFLRAFDVANVISRQIGFFGQFLLAESSLLSLGANGFP